ncbi:putative zinc finger protein, partial [Orchesella cincta]
TNMYSKGGFTSRGKIPGPASKTLFRSIAKSTKTTSQTSTSISNQGGSGMDAKNRSLTFASALTDCWNSSNTGNSSGSTNFSGNSTPNGNQERTSCLFCCNLVIIPNNSGSDKSNEKRSRMLKNLTFHMKLSSKDIPEQCSRTMFPFFKVCEEFVKQLWDFQGMLDKIRLKMSKLVTTIERTVVDGEILNPKIDRNSARQQKFMKLREMILQGYRNKLLVKQQIRDNLVLGNPISDFEPITNLKLERNEDIADDGRSFNSSLCPSPSSCGRSEETVDLTIMGEHDIIEELDVPEEIEIPEEPSSSTSYLASITPQVSTKRRDSMAMVPSYETGYDKQHFSIDDNDVDENDEHLNRVESAQDDDNSYWNQNNTQREEVVASYNENNCTLVISNIHGSDGASFTAETPSLVQIKQEMHTEDNENDEDVDIDVEGDDGSEAMQIDGESNDDIFMLEPRKRRLLFEGVEIYKCLGSKPGTEYLQCSICSHTLENPRRASKGDVTAYTKLKIHIQTAHPLAIPTRTQPPSKRTHGCSLCDEKFTNKETLREHQRTHPQQQQENFSECDICGRVIKRSSEFNLLLHKFSHKNDEERKAAIAANEKGTSSALLSKRLKARKTKKTNSKSKRGSQSLANTSNGDGSPKEIICEICNRTFPRKCYLTLHMRVHSSQKRWPNMNTAKGQEETVVERDAGPPVLQPQQVPVITYPPAQKKINILATNVATPRQNIGALEELCEAVEIVEAEANENVGGGGVSVVATIRNTGEAPAPILKREMTF